MKRYASTLTRMAENPYDKTCAAVRYDQENAGRRDFEFYLELASRLSNGRNHFAAKLASRNPATWAIAERVAGYGGVSFFSAGFLAEKFKDSAEKSTLKNAQSRVSLFLVDLNRSRRAVCAPLTAVTQSNATRSLCATPEPQGGSSRTDAINE